jgi:NAD(P) transhydrogenase
LNLDDERFDLVVIGAGPAGQQAAFQATKLNASVALIERATVVGGECVQRGTLPSKTLRETAVYLAGLSSRSEGLLGGAVPSDVTVESLMRRQHAVRRAHEIFIRGQLERHHVVLRWGRARFLSAHDLEVTSVDGARKRVVADQIVIATGSRPRTPANVPVDHEHVLDSDSILSLTHLPRSLTVLGGGVIACEFASIFAALGVRVTMVDQERRPLAFLDRELTDCFIADFERRGGRFLGGRRFASVESDGASCVTIALEDGEQVRADKLLMALGRVAQVKGLDLEAAGLSLDERGHLSVDESFRTAVPHIYAVGDVIGPPALAATAMDQGRRVARIALGHPVDVPKDVIPIGIYTIPEIAAVGMTEAQAVERFGAAEIGRARFDEVARGLINGNPRGLLKLVATPEKRRLVGAHAVGEGSCEIIHVAQMAISAGFSAERLVDTVFNFPTMAEAYRVAALDLTSGRSSRLRKAA